MAASPTPVRILITVALLAVYGGYTLWMAASQRSWWFGGIAAVAIVACVGTVMLRSWSQFLVYILAAAFISAWGHSIYAAAAAGYFKGFSSWEITRNLTPGALLVLLSGFCSYAVWKQFRRART
jgi:hypothetical protein